MQRVGSGGDHETQRQPIRRNEGGGLIDESAYRGNAARPDHLCARDQGADPMRQIDQLLAGHPRKEVLVAPENPTTSCGNTGPTTIATSASATCRLIRTSTETLRIKPPVSSVSRSAPIVPSVVNVSGTQ